MPITKSRRKDLRANSARYAAKLKTQGLVRVALWVPQEKIEALRQYAAKLMDEAKSSGRAALDP